VSTPDRGEQLAVAVCRLSLDPTRGRIGQRSRVGIALRAAQLAQLALDGRLGGDRFPIALGASDTGTPLLDSVHRAVADRPATPWRRWFSHTGADLRAVSEQLMTQRRWIRDGARLVDVDSAATLAQSVRIEQLTRGGEPPDTVADRVLILLLYGAGSVGGAPRPRAELALVARWLEAGTPSAVEAAVRHGLRAMKRQALLGVVSR
jgi:hypothetical protein